MSRLATALVLWVTSAALTAGDAPPGLALSGSIQPVHDPTIARHQGNYYVFTTGHVGETPGLLPWRVSRDLSSWEVGGAVFAQMPQWASERVPRSRGLWAPDIVDAGGEYRLYYSVSTFGRNDSAIGLAVNDTLDPQDPGYRWVDKGAVVSSTPEDDFNAIDPAVLVDSDGRHWMAFGSFWSGIKLIALDPDTGLRASGDRRMRSLARRPSPGAVEAPYLVERQGWFYLFASFDFCCRGADSTYHTVVGRSGRPTGPFVDRDGRDMLDGGGTVILHADDDPTGRYVGPGHVAVLQDGERDYMVYHAYDTSADGEPVLRIQRLAWTKDGWPKAL